MDPLSFKQWQLRDRLRALRTELRGWRHASRRGPLAIHHSQITAFAKIIVSLERKIFEVLRDPGFQLDDAREMSRMVLGLFRIWEFLRSRLAQRRDENFVDFLRIADELAWELYQTVAEKVYKEPPLVFLNGGFSPFIMTRHQRFTAESVPNELLTDRNLVSALDSLPFPVIGLPWYQIQCIADLPVLAHEVGHSVETDLKLESALDKAIHDALDEKSRAVWKPWRSEVFADVFACVTIGPAFVSTLADFLAPPAAGEAIEQYPPAGLRLDLNLTALRELGLGEDADQLDVRWGKVFGHPPPDADRDAAKRVVQSFLSTSLPGIAGGLAKDLFVGKSGIDEARHVAIKASLLQDLGKGRSMRTLVASARGVYDEVFDSSTMPGDQRQVLEKLKAAMLDVCEDDLRSNENELRAEAWVQGQEQVLNQTVDHWFDRLRGAGGTAKSQP